MWEVI